MGPKLVDYLLYETRGQRHPLDQVQPAGADERPGRNGGGKRHRRQGRRIHARRRRRSRRAGDRADRRGPRRSVPAPILGLARDRTSPARTSPATAARMRGSMATRQHFFHGFTQLHRDIAHDPQADDRDDQRAGGRVRHGHGAALRHPYRLRGDPLHRLSQRRPDHRERRLILSAEDGRPRPRAGVRLHRRTERRAGATSGAC